MVPRVQTMSSADGALISCATAARSFETGGQILRRPMLAAVHGGGVIAIKLLRGVDHRLRFQRGGGAVQIDAVLRERGKLLAKKAGVKRRHTLIITGLSRWVILSYFAAGDKRSCLLGLIVWKNLESLLCY